MIIIGIILLIWGVGAVVAAWIAWRDFEKTFEEAGVIERKRNDQR